jgi:hypothetical protein
MAAVPAPSSKTTYPPSLGFSNIAKHDLPDSHRRPAIHSGPDSAFFRIMTAGIWGVREKRYNRAGVTGRYPHNLQKVLEQYTKEKTYKILSDTREILTWLMQRSSRR